MIGAPAGFGRSPCDAPPTVRCSERGVARGMSTSPASGSAQPTSEHDDAEAVIDQEAAEIDARSPDAPEQIAELAEEADDLGLATPQPAEVVVPAQD